MDKSEFKVSEGTNSLMKWTVSRCGKAREVVFKPSIFVMTGCRGKKDFDWSNKINQSATVVTRGYRKFTLCTCQCVPS